MNKLTNWFRTKHKIVPTYSQEHKCNGYVAEHHTIFGWIPMPMMQYDGQGEPHQVHSYFKTYEDAVAFIKHETTIIEDETVSDTKGN